MVCRNNTKRLVVICVYVIFLIVSIIPTNTYAADKEFYACPKQKVNVAVPYRPDVSGDIKYTFSGCNCMTVSGSYPNYSIVIRDEGSYHITTTSNSPFLLNYDYYFYISHVWNDDYTVDQPPTCTETGVESIHCGRCGVTKDEKSIPASGHTWEDNATVDVEPTCTTDGSKSVHCEKCDAQMDIEVINRLGHDIIHHKEKAPYLESGWLEYDTCSRCDYSTFEGGYHYGVWMFGEELTSEYYSDDSGAWTYDAQTSTLTILRNTGKTSTHTGFPCIYSNHDLIIDCAGNDYSISCPQDTSSMCIYADGDLTIRGGGSLFVQSAGNKEFCVACASSVTIDGTELSAGISGTGEEDSFFTGIFADNIKVKNDGTIYFGFGPCDMLRGIVANNSGSIEIDKGQVSLLHSSGGRYSEYSIDCGLLNCIDGSIDIYSNSSSDYSNCITANSIKLIKGGITTRTTGNKGYSLSADRIDATTDFTMNLSPKISQWTVDPVYYPSNFVLNNVVIHDIPDQEYTGRAIEPTLEITYEDYSILTGNQAPGLVEYKNNTNVGTAKAMVSFYDINGIYLGTLEKEFTIIAEKSKRIYGASRYDTAIKAADEYKRVTGSEKFENVVVAYGLNYPDALSGGYLAKVKNAPILLVQPSVEDYIVNYIDENIADEGKVFILGGTGVVSSAFENKIRAKGIDPIRLGGKDRYETNLEILKAAGVDDEEILICTGTGYADSLSASAVGKPILLVGSTLTDGQKEYIQSLNTKKFYLIGGTGVVTDKVGAELGNLGYDSERLWGPTRYETSTAVATKFFPKAKTVILAYAQNFPDGLSGGPLAMKKNAPIILTASAKTEAAAKYVKETGALRSITLGGPALISDAAVKAIMG